MTLTEKPKPFVFSKTHVLLQMNCIQTLFPGEGVEKVFTRQVVCSMTATADAEDENHPMQSRSYF